MSDLLLRHYAAAPVIAVESRTQDDATAFGKPCGFWVSVDNCESNWRSWCESEGFGLNDLAVAHDVALAPSANILRLSSVDDVLRFTNEYESPARRDSYNCIEWHRVATKFQGIIIAPYIWELRLDWRARWYYLWSCASGCVWDANAIARVTVTETV